MNEEIQLKQEVDGIPGTMFLGCDHLPVNPFWLLNNGFAMQYLPVKRIFQLKLTYNIFVYWGAYFYLISLYSFVSCTRIGLEHFELM